MNESKNFRYFFSDYEIAASPSTASKSTLFQLAKKHAVKVAEEEGTSIPSHAIVIRIERASNQWRVMWNSKKETPQELLNELYKHEVKFIKRFDEIE